MIDMETSYPGHFCSAAFVILPIFLTVHCLHAKATLFATQIVTLPDQPFLATFCMQQNPFFGQIWGVSRPLLPNKIYHTSLYDKIEHINDACQVSLKHPFFQTPFCLTCRLGQTPQKIIFSKEPTTHAKTVVLLITDIILQNGGIRNLAVKHQFLPLCRRMFALK